MTPGGIQMTEKTPRLRDRTALVTGASQGLGAGIARELAAQGAKVLVCSRSEENLRAMVGANPGDWWIEWEAADVTDPEAAPRLAEIARARFGRLDILVCNAAGPPPCDFADASDAQWQAAFELILLGPIRLIRACLPLLRLGGGGHILLCGSISALRPVPHLLLSNTLRPGLAGLARHLAIELAEDNVLVNAIAPGFFDTERSREVLAAAAQRRGLPLEEVAAANTARVPLRRQGDPRELGKLVAFLVSPENSYLTGRTLVIDGGMLLT
ncbi:MAG: SDR family oxidoreductase [Candidatus Eisenbacteria bacterium]|nr:SDR family oxidoreductase [Candidatus Eisenbacteria bacterium]